MGRLILFAAFGILALMLLRWLQRTPAPRVARVLRQAALWGVAGLLVLLAASGRLSPLLALLGLAAPLLGRLLRLLQVLPLVQRLLALLPRVRGAGGPTLGGGSRVRTRFLDMAIDPATGTLSGRVLEGRFRGRDLADLGLGQLLEMHAECASDPQSLAALEAYLERAHGPAWRQAWGSGPAAEGPMTREDAYAILGLTPGADERAVVEAHRRLMQRLHPDRGGSPWLAVKINQAKRLLLGGR
jgi:hypothetical protein